VRALKEYFTVSDKSVVVVQPGRPVAPSVRWRHIHDVGLMKVYEFEQLPVRDRFIIQCIALETHRGKEDVTWTIEGKTVTVVLKEPPVGLTEPMIEFAKTLDSMRREMDYVAVKDGEIEHDYTF